MSEDGTRKLDLSEKGKTRDGQPDSLDRRLFMQLQVFGNCREPGSLVEALEAADIEGVLYLDVNDPTGIGLLTFHEDPTYFVTTVRQLLNRPPFSELTAKAEYTMFGRTYTIGYERGLELHLLQKPRYKVCNPDMPWAIWYPLQRRGSFEKLTESEQLDILREHGTIGRAYGEAGYGVDIRLACYGLDKNDNDFIVGLVGPELFPLSSIVQSMRKTEQTSQYIREMGPFFIGKAYWQHMNAG